MLQKLWLIIGIDIMKFGELSNNVMETNYLDAYISACS